MKIVDKLIETFEDPNPQMVLALSIMLFVFSLGLLVVASESITQNTITSIDVVISSLLTFSLVALYFQQNRIQQQHLKILQAEQIPKLRFELLGFSDNIERHPAHALIKLENFGDGPAFNIEVEYEFSIEDNRFESKTEKFRLRNTKKEGHISNSLSNGDTEIFRFPVWMNYEVTSSGEELRVPYISPIHEDSSSNDDNSIRFDIDQEEDTLRSADYSISSVVDDDIQEESDITMITDLVAFCEGIEIAFDLKITYEDSYGNRESPYGEEYLIHREMFSGFKQDEPYYELERLFK